MLHARERLRLVPAVSFDAALPAVEAALAGGGPAATGLVCVGRDGQPRRTARGGWHYNILDPRVQAAVGALIDELAAGRVPPRGSAIGRQKSAPEGGPQVLKAMPPRYEWTLEPPPAPPAGSDD